jgi:hypothetical protein
MVSSTDTRGASRVRCSFNFYELVFCITTLILGPSGKSGCASTQNDEPEGLEAAWQIAPVFVFSGLLEQDTLSSCFAGLCLQAKTQDRHEKIASGVRRALP